jgi:hypothetical protein
MGIFFYWISSLLIHSNDYLPIMEMFFSLFSLQFLFGPALSYNGFDEYTIASYRMKINSETYFQYTIPMFIAFPLGFGVFFKRKEFKINIDSIDKWFVLNAKLPYVFIVIGFFAPFISSFIPSALVFVSYLLESFKFIGLFILICSHQKLKPLLLVIIYGAILISSFQGGMFHDLLIWIIVLGLIISYRYKPSFSFRISAMILFALFASFIQSIKGGLREKTWVSGGEKTSYELIESINKQNVSENNGMFTKESIGPQINRINQGWILASTMDNVPSNESHTYGALTSKYVYSAFMPRFLAPDKLRAGDQNIFNKYSGHSIYDDTAMGLGILTDAYVEFGENLALIYVFLFGLMYGYILNKFLVISKNYPILILFSILAFIYPMRPDCETQTALGHLFKTIMLLFLIFSLFKKTFKLDSHI